MTKVITRYFESVDQAFAARRELILRQRFSARIVHLYDSADGLADALGAANVDPQTAQAYQSRVASGGAVLMVLADYKPLGVAKTTRETAAAMGAADMGGLVEEVVVKGKPMTTLSVMQDHPHIMTRARDPHNTNFHMADWPIPLISRRVPSNYSAFPRHAHMANFPISLINRRKPMTASIFPRHARMANIILPLTSRRKPFTGSIFPRHARMANLILPLISRRKPYRGSIIGRHQHMANWPFPHLINGETGTNALMPGGPRMANFPISLISKRKPFTGSIFPRHARMANFPISLISRRKPFTGSIFPRHARMADMFLPLVFKQSEGETRYGSQSFSLSKIMRIPTVVKR